MTTSDLLALKAATVAAAADLWQKAAWRFFFRLGELKGPVDPEVMNSRLIPNYRKCATTYGWKFARLTLTRLLNPPTPSPEGVAGQI